MVPQHFPPLPSAPVEESLLEACGKHMKVESRWVSVHKQFFTAWKFQLPSVLLRAALEGSSETKRSFSRHRVIIVCFKDESSDLSYNRNHNLRNKNKFQILWPQVQTMMQVLKVIMMSNSQVLNSYLVQWVNMNKICIHRDVIVVHTARFESFDRNSPCHSFHIICICYESTKAFPLQPYFIWHRRCRWPSNYSWLWCTQDGDEYNAQPKNTLINLHCEIEKIGLQILIHSAKFHGHR